MAKFEIIVGSMLGATEYVADALEILLTKYSHDCQIHLQPDIKNLDNNAIWLICSSTHGAGDLPDNIQPFAKQLEKVSLSDTDYLVVGLGDSSYDTFCEAAKHLSTLMANSGANRLTNITLIDVLNCPIPEDEACLQLEKWLSQ